MLSAFLLLAITPANLPATADCFQEQAVDTIEEVVLNGAGDREQEIRMAMRIRVGRRFLFEDLRRDQSFLWQRMRVRVNDTRTFLLPSGGVRVEFDVTVLPSVKRVVFVGNDEYERSELLAAINLSGQVVDQGRIPVLLQELEDFYHDEAFRHVSLEAKIDEEIGQLSILINEGAKVRIDEIKFTGNSAFPSSSALGMGTSVSSAMTAGDGVLFFPGSHYKRGLIDQDLIAIEAFYRDFGYLDARAWLEEESYSEDGDNVALNIGIYEGPQYIVRSVSFRSTGDGDLQFSDDELMEIITLRAGQTYEAARFAVDESLLRKHYGRMGHPAIARAIGENTSSFFSMGGRDRKPQIVVDEESSEIDIVYLIQEGRPMRVRDVLVTGNVHTRDRVIRREISLEPGDLADGYEATRSWRRLQGKSWFRDEMSGHPYVDWRFIETERPDWVDLRFDVGDMATTGQFLFGGGINTNTGPFLSVTLNKSNFDMFNLPSSWGNAFSEIIDGTAFVGGGQNLSLRAAPGTEYSTYSLSFTEPDLLNDHINRLSFNFNGFNTMLRLLTHDERRTGGRIRFGRHFGRDFSLTFGPESQLVSVIDPSSNAPSMVIADEGQFSMSGFHVGASYNTIADAFSPVDGARIALNHRMIGGVFGGDMEFGSTDLRLEKHFPLFNDSRGRPWVFGAHGRLRIANESGSYGRMPYSERFFLGGQGTLRGFSYRGVGDRENGFALGGEAAWNSSLELRFPVVSTKVRGAVDEMEYVRGALWVDMGGVGESIDNFGATRISAGVGVRVRIPFMPQLPLALDFGWPVQSLDGDQEEVFAFQMGKF